jgi:acetylornithine/succinyldiaminopimelate/putrescine aminotransferase
MLESDLPARVGKAHDYLTGKLEALQSRQPLITGWRGKGLLLAVGLTRDVADRVTLSCLQKGLIVNNVRPNAVRLTPPLTVSNAELDEAVSILEKALASV